ncbi:MAG: hypothetical protein CL607_05670 [Anaerolineaceae bacterium]|nr:hypothetical protein [Anaerolineaceae bacterium]
MAISPAEKRIRAGLALTRTLTAYVPVSIAQWGIRKSAERVSLGDNIQREAVNADGVRCEWLTPNDSLGDRVLLYIHGGGFIYGLTSMHLEMAAYLAKKIGIRVLMVDYRLAPEHPFPAALDDCVTAYRWLLQQGFAGDHIAIAGDSAGGNLTITTMLQLRDNDIPLPGAAACLSPVTDLSNKQGLFQQQYDAVLHPRATRFMNASYLAGQDARNPLISPVFSDLQGLPPMLIHVGEEEVLCDDAVRIATLAEEVGVSVQLEIYPRMWHVWQLFLSLPQAVQSLDAIAHFIDEHLDIT